MEDFPSQYFGVIDRTAIELARAGDRVWVVMSEMGAEGFEVDGERVTVRVIPRVERVGDE